MRIAGIKVPRKVSVDCVNTAKYERRARLEKKCYIPGTLLCHNYPSRGERPPSTVHPVVVASKFKANFGSRRVCPTYFRLVDFTRLYLSFAPPRIRGFRCNMKVTPLSRPPSLPGITDSSTLRLQLWFREFRGVPHLQGSGRQHCQCRRSHVLRGPKPRQSGAAVTGTGTYPQVIGS